jgi:hypothetical protein
MKRGQNWAKNDMLLFLMLAPWILISADQIVSETVKYLQRANQSLAPGS